MPVLGTEHLQEALGSILNQTLQEIEVLIVPEPETELKLPEDPRLIQIQPEKRLGVSAARNLGIRLSSGRYVALMDADDISHPDRLRLQVKFLEEHPEIGVVGTQEEYITDNGGYWRHRFLWPGRKHRPRLPTEPEEIRRKMLTSNPVCGPSVLARREVFDKVGLFSEQYSFAEDYELWMRMIAAEIKIANLPGYLYKYRVHEGQATKSYIQTCNTINATIRSKYTPQILRSLFVFWQFNGDNQDGWCNLQCVYCYGKNKTMQHKWNGRGEDWEKAFTRFQRPIYFVLSYGESMGSRGFPEVTDIIGRHENWECSLVTNLTINPQELLESRLAKEKRLYVHASFHPLGGADWEKFKEHLLMLQVAEIPTIVLYLFYPPQIEAWKGYWRWLDEHNIRTCVRRYVGEYEGQHYPESYSPEVKAFFRALLQPKSVKYGLELKRPTGKKCTAGKDMILVHWDGRVSYCADVDYNNVGNIFDPNFKLSPNPIRCPSRQCGGDYGLLHVEDKEFGPNPEWLWHDPFVCQVEKITGGGSERVHYPNRLEMEKWLLS